MINDHKKKIILQVTLCMLLLTGLGVQSDFSHAVGPAYPNRSDYRIKGIEPNFWPDYDEIAGNNAGGVAMNLVWTEWEGAVKVPPCSAGYTAYDGHCFKINTATDNAIRTWTSKGLIVTAIVYGVPQWARAGRVCTPAQPGFEMFCAPNNPNDYARFVGMLAKRYNGLNGNGRIADFVIHNEVNTNDWFDIGCGQGTPCNVTAWLDTYAANFNAAYDQVKLHQSAAKVMISLDQHFGQEYDMPSATNPLLSVKTFLSGFASRVGSRQWNVAYHPYTPNLTRPSFTADDYPKVTLGNIGMLSGWLRKTFPNKPFAWEIHITESGISSGGANGLQEQSKWLCNSFRNVLGTPDVKNYLYFSMTERPEHIAVGMLWGLREVDGSPKPAWIQWALANRNDLNPKVFSCGFEDLPYIRLRRGYNPNDGSHWASTRIFPSRYTIEQGSVRLSRRSISGQSMRLLYECDFGTHNLISKVASCENDLLIPRGTVGYAYTTQVPGTIPLYRCRMGNGWNHFVSLQADCEGFITEDLLGYVLP